jgi:HAD superfamily hydrolase (TIGR01509 family)
MIKAILMDFNGVIINDEPIQHRAYREVFANFGIDVTDEMYYSRMGMDDKTFIHSIMDEAGQNVDDETVRGITESKTAHWRNIVAASIPLFDGVDGFIKKMARKFELGIVSMAKREEIDFILDTTGLGDYFSVVISAEEIKDCKPDPECYRKGFQEIDLCRVAKGHLPMIHSDCLVIEDSPQGVMSARAADLPVLAVSNTVEEKELRAAGAFSVTDRLSEWMPESIIRVFDLN